MFEHVVCVLIQTVGFDLVPCLYLLLSLYTLYTERNNMGFQSIYMGLVVWHYIHFRSMYVQSTLSLKAWCKTSCHRVGRSIQSHSNVALVESQYVTVVFGTFGLSIPTC